MINDRSDNHVAVFSFSGRTNVHKTEGNRRSWSKINEHQSFHRRGGPHAAAGKRRTLPCGFPVVRLGDPASRYNTRSSLPSIQQLPSPALHQALLSTHFRARYLRSACSPGITVRFYFQFSQLSLHYPTVTRATDSSHQLGASTGSVAAALCLP